LGIKADDRYQLAQQYLGNQSYILAEQEIRKALDLAPQEPTYFELLALIYQAQGRLRQAGEAYHVALQSDDVSSSTLVNYSTLLLLREQYDEAIDMSRRALQKPGYARPALAHTNIGLAYLKKGDLAQAEEHFLIALDYQPGLAETHHNLGLVYERFGKRHQAILSFREAIRSDAGYTEAHASLGRLLLQDGRPEEARNAFERVIDLDPDSDLAMASRQHLKRLPR
jgi:Tfp pilus assembly protein PilF